MSQPSPKKSAAMGCRAREVCRRCGAWETSLTPYCNLHYLVVGTELLKKQKPSRIPWPGTRDGLSLLGSTPSHLGDGSDMVARTAYRQQGNLASEDPTHTEQHTCEAARKAALPVGCSFFIYPRKSEGRWDAR